MMKRSHWNRWVLWVGIFAVLLVGMTAGQPHFHSSVGGQEQENCTPCYLHQALLPLAESSTFLIFQNFVDESFVPSADLPVLSQRTTGLFFSRAPPATF